MLDNLKKLLRGNYYSLNTVKLSKENLRRNYYFLSSIKKEIKIAPVLKSNAYGHGITHIAKLLDDINAPFFCVDSLHEAYELQKAGIKTQILIMGYINPHNLSVKKLPFSYAIYDKELLSAVNKYQPGARVHLFVDTGMHREGITLEELPSFVKFIKSLPNIELEGVMSHLGEADDPNNALTKAQFEHFQKALDVLRKSDISPKYMHILASSGLLHTQVYSKYNLGNLARVGIALYGISPDTHNSKLKPVLSLRTKIVQIKKIKKNSGVGYGFTFKPKKDTTIGILPIGYNDGVDRGLSNKGKVLVGNIACNIIGRVSMNITTVDLTGIKNPQVGQEVIVFSNDQKQPNTIEKISQLTGDIPYETLVHINQSTKREIF